ncbi:MAG: hypothetical protein E6I85_01825 [Chloroflexi bacterium]|nr:MAG: hypothetical protein E6I85_01825 [Chloroflexota bacterium]
MGPWRCSWTSTYSSSWSPRWQPSSCWMTDVASTHVSTLSPARADLFRIAAIVDALLLLAAAALAVFHAPADTVQGVVQKIFYLHVPSAIAAYAAFAVVLAGGLVFLWNESPAADRLARVAAEVGLLFTTVMLVSGSLWARPIWGTYWVW